MPEATSLIFLDIDGVLNCAATTQRVREHMTGIEPRFVALLQSLLRQVDADVVISSAWRSAFSLPVITHFLEEAGLDRELCRRFVGMTPLECRMSDTSSTARARQIRMYLSEHPADRFVTIDDMSLPFACAVTVVDGLTQENVDHAVALLGRIDCGIRQQ